MALGIFLAMALAADRLLEKPCHLSNLNGDVCRFVEETLWNWIEPLTIVGVLTVSGLIAYRGYKRRNKDRERQVILKSYFGEMTKLFTDPCWLKNDLEDTNGKPKSTEALELLAAAHLATAEVLPKLDGVRKGAVLKFLSESGWLQEISLASTDLKGAFLVGASLQEANLQGANLIGANLLQANFAGANLEAANLGGAFLRQSNFSQAYLVGTSLVKTDLEGSNFEEANLICANLKGANLEDSILIGADLRGTNLRQAVLQRASLIKANLEGANLSGASLRGALFMNAKLLKTNLSGVGLEEAFLNDAYLCCTILPAHISLNPSRDCSAFDCNSEVSLTRREKVSALL